MTGPGPVTVLERASVAKSGVMDPAGAGDDRIVVTPGFLAVIDAETAKPGPADGPGAPGAPGRLADALAAALTACPPAADATTVLATLTAAAARVQRPPVAGWTPGAVAAIVLLARRELLVLGSVHTRVDPPGAGYGTGRWRAPGLPLDRPAAARRAALLTRYLAAGVPVAHLRATDPGRALILDELRAARAHRNRGGPWGFASLDGTRIPRGLVTCHRLPAGPCHVTLASDGYPPAGSDRAAAEGHLARCLAVDPLCIGVLQGTKGPGPADVSFDDRSWLAVTLGPAE